MDQPKHDDEFDYAIIGGGASGTALALALARRKGNERIIWYRGVKRSTASSDISKIVRTRYLVEGYAIWAEKALSDWKTDETFKDFFHNCGGIRVEGHGSKPTMSSKEMQEMVGSDQEPDLDSGEFLRLDRSIGSVDFNLAIQAAAQEAERLGVQIYDKDVTKLLVQDEICTGVEVSDKVVEAKKIIVAAGPWTPRLLEKSGVSYCENFFKVVAVPVATMRLGHEVLNKLRNMPIIIAEQGEIMLSEVDQSLKITSTKSFPIEHPDNLDEPIDIDIKPNSALLKKMLPQFSGRKLESCHLSDLMTPNQHPLLDIDPKYSNLQYVLGGNFHFAKFLLQGEVMLRVLESRGKRQTDANDLVLRFLHDTCGWHRTVGEEGAHENMVPSVNRL